MTGSRHDHAGLAGYVLGALDEDERAVVEAHLAECGSCRAERAGWAEMERSLGRLPPEAFLDGPPDGADLLQQRVLSRIRAESARHVFRRRLTGGVAAGLILGAAFGAGTVLGSEQQGPPVAASPSGSPSIASSVPPPGTMVASAVDSGTGAAMTVRITPAAGWVRVTAAARGISAGRQCQLWVIARGGGRELAGSWLVSETAAREGTTLDGSALVPPEQVAGVEVSTRDGVRLVTARV